MFIVYTDYFDTYGKEKPRTYVDRSYRCIEHENAIYAWKDFAERISFAKSTGVVSTEMLQKNNDEDKFCLHIHYENGEDLYICLEEVE